MACFSPNGQPPNPTRVWSRVQGRCSTEVATTNSPIVYFPLTKEFIPIQEAALRYRMIQKGNVLQYKKNSSDLTKKQRYSLIASGQWTNRHSTFATQTVDYTNPNTKGLKRVNYTTIYADDGSPANLPVTCPQSPSVVIPQRLPVKTPPTNQNTDSSTIYIPQNENSQVNPGYPVLCPQYVNPAEIIVPTPVIETPVKLPEKEEPEVNVVLPYVKPSTPAPEREVIPDGGNFVCVTEDICGNVTLSGQQQYAPPNYCNPTSASDVPGKIQNLCYNSLRLSPYYPRQRYQMGNSGDKFPTGYKFT